MSVKMIYLFSFARQYILVYEKYVILHTDYSYSA